MPSAPPEIQKVKTFLSERFNITFARAEPGEYHVLSRFMGAPAGEPCLFVASKNGKIVGHQTLLPMTVKTDNGYARVALSMSSEVEEGFRGLGIFPVLINESIEYCKETGIDFVYGFPNENSHDNFVKYSGFKTMGVVPLLVKPVSPIGPLTKLLSSEQGAAIVNMLLRPLIKGYCMLKAPGKNNSVRIEIVSSDIVNADKIYQQASREREFMVEKDRAFLKWRYKGKDYIRLLGKDTDSGKEAVLIGCIKEKLGYRIGFITDMLLPETDIAIGIGRQLVKKIGGIFWKERVDFIGSLAPAGTRSFRVLKSMGFFELPQRFFKRRFWVVGKHVNEGAVRFYNLDRWVLTLGDIDIV